MTNGATPCLVEEAIGYASRGLPVFPCKNHGKEPLTTHGFKDASTDPNVIRNWWKRWPGANIGIPTGPSSNLFVLDMDGEAGDESLRKLEAMHGALPGTRTIVTSPGHLQYWFSYPSGLTIKSSTGIVGSGLDVRAIGGYVVAPPSIHPRTTRPYVISSNEAPVAAPEWLIALASKTKDSNGAATAAGHTISEHSIPQGQRNSALTSLAGTLRAKNFNEHQILEHLRLINVQQCQPPLPEHELAAIAKSIGKKPVPTVEETISLDIDDMPEAVLSGRLGELCQRVLGDFPRAYAWPSLVTVAGTLVTGTRSLPSNLFTALVGPVGSGKTQANERAMRALGLDPEGTAPPVLKLKAGSGEGLLKSIGDVGGAARLYSVDEYGHLLEKAHVENSTFPQILNGLFYGSRQSLRIARGEEVTFNCSLSILGGLVDETFGDAFGKNTTTGLYDRTAFGQCPTGFSYDYRPFKSEVFLAEPRAVPVHPEVWEARTNWVKTIPGITGRIAEISLRIAGICAAFDGKTILRESDLGPALAFAQNQARIRTLLRPNSGETFEGRIAFKFLAWLERYGPEGQWLSKRKMFKDCRAYDIGPTTSDRALSVLVFNGDIEEHRAGRKSLVRLVP